MPLTSRATQGEYGSTTAGRRPRARRRSLPSQAPGRSAHAGSGTAPVRPARLLADGVRDAMIDMLPRSPATTAPARPCHLLQRSRLEAVRRAWLAAAQPAVSLAQQRLPLLRRFRRHRFTHARAIRGARSGVTRGLTLRAPAATISPGIGMPSSPSMDTWPQMGSPISPRLRHPGRHHGRQGGAGDGRGRRPGGRRAQPQGRRDTLYGRYWGRLRATPSRTSRFATEAIDYAITHGLQRVEAGAQGDHDPARLRRCRPSAH